MLKSRKTCNIGLWILCLFLQHTVSQNPSLKLGAVFKDGDNGTDEEFMFQYAINKTSIEGDTIYLQPDENILDFKEKVCLEHKGGMISLIGPSTSYNAFKVKTVCSSLGIPYIDTKWAPYRSEKQLILNMMPDNNLFSKAILDLIEFYDWTTLTLLYEDDAGLMKFKELFESASEIGINIMLSRLVGEYEVVLKNVKKMSTISNVIIDCRQESLEHILTKMNENKMFEYYHLIFTSLDFHIFSSIIEGITTVEFKVTSLQMFDLNEEPVRDLQNSLNDARSIFDLTIQSALIYDAVNLVGRALNYSSAQGKDIKKIKNLDCDLIVTNQTWRHGTKMFNALKKAAGYNGITGKLSFNGNGMREDVKLYIYEYTQTGKNMIGTWNKTDGFAKREVKIIEKPNIKKILRITSVLAKPFVMLKDTTESQGRMYEGFCIELLNYLAQMMDFEYKLTLVEDGMYGTLVNADTNEWNGMVKELIDKKADLAVAPLTINLAREKVIGFSKPYMYLGLSILYNIHEAKSPGIFSFLNPLSFDVWLYILIAFLSVSIMLFLVARFSPYEWYNSHPCNPECDVVENQFTFLNCMWFSFGGIMQQGSELTPKAFSTRALSGFYWFFSLILLCSYTANLAAFLTVNRMTSPIQNADDLARQTAIEYGTLSSGATQLFFKRSSIPTFEKMWQFMSNKPEVFVDREEDGVNRVLSDEEDYAFLMESTATEYYISQYCRNLTRIGGLLNTISYGIGTPLGSHLRDRVTQSILQLQENGTLIEMENKWWHKGSYKKDSCKAYEIGDDDNRLGYENIGGVFVVLVIGIAFSLFAVVSEFLWKSRQYAEIEKRSMCQEMRSSMWFAMNCKQNQRRKRLDSNIDRDHKIINPFTTSVR
ncbi:glutamate receptor ionotropic, kainate 2-like [Anneissia japonica]|uniref:glutamate receptor ionotropic, kainate 2-like n=1 Tax=Anneissia japonica TaxID=1529436 RepID=UPI0014255E8E|nr:glutamate receptor ionotropic, kainate 2-like [Anneissia japonica]